MVSLQFFIDNVCANFTADSLNGLVKGSIAAGPCNIDDIAREIAGRDRSLDIKSARTLAEAAVDSLVRSRDIAILGSDIYSADSAGHTR